MLPGLASSYPGGSSVLSLLAALQKASSVLSREEGPEESS